MTMCQALLTPAFHQRGLCLLAAGVDVPPPTPDIVPLPPSPHPIPPSPAPVPPEIIEPLKPGQNEPVREPIVPTPGPRMH
jgi:hypothetical protein